jgi:TRAP-type C4-dicarboxylate transport system substrate-binding protein
MPITRRTITLAGALAAPAILRAGIARAAARTLKISHQFPGGSIDQGDFRDRLVRKFAAEVQARTNGELDFEIYPGATLMKTVAQFSALRRGALDLSLYPLADAGGEVPEVNIGLMPMLVTSYRQGMAWKTADVGRDLLGVLDRRGVKLLAWVWQAGGCASRAGAVVGPDDTKGLKIRGGSRAMDQMLRAAGGIVASLPSDGLYAAMRKSALDAAVTSSTSLISFRLQEISKNVTSARQGSFCFMLEPLLMSKEVFDSLTTDQRKIVTEVAASMEDFGLRAAQGDDDALAVVYGQSNVQIEDFSKDALEKWQVIAEASAWKDFSARDASCARLLKSAQGVTA